MESRTLYDQDEHAWIEQQIALMRAGKLDQLDGRNLVLLLNDVMIRDRRELRSRLTSLFIYQLKIQHASEPVTVRMVSGIIEQQQEINTLLASVPRLQEHASGQLDAAYRDAVRHVSIETGVSARRLPSRSPWSLDQAIEYEPPEPGTVIQSDGTKSKSQALDEATAKVLAGGRVVEVARDYGIPRQTLSDRVKRALTEAAPLTEDASPTAEPDADAMHDANGEERRGCD